MKNCVLFKFTEIIFKLEIGINKYNMHGVFLTKFSQFQVLACYSVMLFHCTCCFRFPCCATCMSLALKPITTQERKQLLSQRNL